MHGNTLATTMHYRHVSTAEKQRDVESLDLSLGNSTSRPKKRRRTNRTTVSFQCIRLGLAATLVTAAFVAFSGTPSRSSSLDFETQSKNAPLCTPLSKPQDVSYTLVTQLSQDRLWMMEHHCARYPHPMSIAVWTNSTRRKTLDDLLAMKCDLNLIQVEILDAHNMPYNDYPVNQLRNMALRNISTTHIVYIDVDFWTSDGMYDILKGTNVTNALVGDRKQALVIPAFQLFRQCVEWKDCREKNVPYMPHSADDLYDMIREKRGHMFDPTNTGGHGSTRYRDWLLQDDGTLFEIPCLKSNRYEPFLVIRYCRDLPPFQEAFSGYGKNKMSWMMQLVRSGYVLSQVGGVFLVHYPHLDSESRQHWNEAPNQLKVYKEGNKDHVPPQIRRPNESETNLSFASYKRGQVDQLFVKYRKWLRERVPDESRIGLCEDHQDDDSKLWVERSPES
eukprot:scaffold4634_cov122-Cylindrotheca_fusiformis.AAC.3